MESKRCGRCGEEKPITEFGIWSKTKATRRSTCRTCENARKRRWGHLHLENRRERDRQRAPRRKQYKAAYNRDYRQSKRQTIRNLLVGWHEKHPQAQNAHQVVYKAIQKGWIIPQPCERCGGEDHLHAHHDDYGKPLCIRWLCATCHRLLHWEHRRSAIAAGPLPLTPSPPLSPCPVAPTK